MAKQTPSEPQLPDLAKGQRPRRTDKQLAAFAAAVRAARAKPKSEKQLAFLAIARAKANEQYIADKQAIIARARASMLARTHCLNGHRYSGENLMYVGGNRQCRTCRKLSYRSGNIGPEVMRRVIDAANEGKTLAEIDGRLKRCLCGRAHRKARTIEQIYGCPPKDWKFASQAFRSEFSEVPCRVIAARDCCAMGASS